MIRDLSNFTLLVVFLLFLSNLIGVVEATRAQFAVGNHPMCTTPHSRLYRIFFTGARFGCLLGSWLRETPTVERESGEK